MPPRLTLLAAALLVPAIAAACSQADPTPNGGSPTAEQSAVAEPTATELRATGDALAAGTYTRADFEPAITIDLDGSWHAVQLAEGFFDVQQDVGTPDVIAVQFARPLGVFGAQGLGEPGTPDDAVELLEGNPALEVLERSSSRIGGLTGSQVTVENAGDAHANVMQVPPGALGIDPGRRLWIAFFETDDGLLAIMVGGSTATWDAALAAAEPVLESVQIGR